MKFDRRKPQKKLRLHVESHDDVIRRKAEIMVGHFHEQVVARRKVVGQGGPWS